MNELVIMRKPLTKLLLVQWSRFGAVPIRISGSTLFTGVNGSGKSTILDAMTYLITGNTQFNKAAQDKDRTVLGYVRGDTKSKGEYQYLRHGNVISYVVMEFYSPNDEAPITIGVCIESPDEHTMTASWFVKVGAFIDDFNFYNKNGTMLEVTPKNELRVRGEKIKANEFMRKEKGIAVLQRILGLRCDSGEFKRKLMKMMSFQIENNINKFIRDSVLPEVNIDTIDNLKEQKRQFEKIKETYDNILKMQKLLDEIEEKTVDFEKCERNLHLKSAEMLYQNYVLSKVNLDRDISNLNNENVKLEYLVRRYEEIDSRFKQVAENRNNAKKQYEENNLSAGINDLEKKICEQKTALSVLEKNIEKINKLKIDIAELVDSFDSSREGKVLRHLDCGDYSAEEKYSALKWFDEQVKSNIERLNMELWGLNQQLERIETKLVDIQREINTLESNQMTYPADVKMAQEKVNSILSARGIPVKVRTFAELVEQITKPEWRDALEVYLRNTKFNFIVDGEYASEVLEIFHSEKITGTDFVLTDKLKDYSANNNSAATILSIPNKFARRYANYLLGRLHLCNTLNELHDHPEGGIMTDGTLAKGYAVKNLRLNNIRYALGAEAIRLQLESKKSERKNILIEQENIQQRKKQIKALLTSLQKPELSIKEYHFESINEYPILRNQIALDIAEKKRLENNPELLALKKLFDDAEAEYNRIDKERLSINSTLDACKNEIGRLTESIKKDKISVDENKKLFDDFILMHLDLKKEVIAEYARLTSNKNDGIAVKQKTIDNLKTECQKAQRAMEDSQIKYCNLSGRDVEERGISYISFYRGERNKIANVDAEQTKEKLENKQKDLESAFITDFVASLCENVDNARNTINAINNELAVLPFGQDIYSFKASERKDKAAFFRIKRKIYDKVFGMKLEYVESMSEDSELLQDIEEFMELILNDEDESEYADYRTYYNYDMEIKNRIKTDNIVADLSEKQGSASNGEKQTPYYIILAASLMQCYPRNTCCARLAFIDEAFAALSQERIEQMVGYLEQNGFQVIYAAPPEKINSIGKHIDSTVSLVETGRYTNVVEGMANGILIG